MNDLSNAPRSDMRPGAYRVEIITCASQLSALKPDWDAVFARDDMAGVFLSHDWLAPALEANPNRWRVFVVRDARGKPACLFPVKQRVHWSTTADQFQTEFDAGGRLAWGEYTGFVCDPAQEEAALFALAQALRHMPWKTLSLRYEPTRRRSEIFARALGDGFSYRFRPYRINKGEVDNLVGFRVPLDAGFEGVLTSRISANTRQKIRRFRRKLLDTGTYRVSEASAQTIERDIAGLLRNWIAQWALQKGADRALEIAERYGRALLTAHQMGCLHLPMLWQGNNMLGALGHVIDRKQRSVHFLVAGRDPRARDPAVGLLLHAYALEWAVDAGLEHYDFGHGDQDYKQSFGGDRFESHYLTVRRQADGPVFDLSGLPRALDRLARFGHDGKTGLMTAGAEQLAELVQARTLHDLR